MEHVGEMESVGEMEHVGEKLLDIRREGWEGLYHPFWLPIVEASKSMYCS